MIFATEDFRKSRCPVDLSGAATAPIWLKKGITYQVKMKLSGYCFSLNDTKQIELVVQSAL
jgi:hypothetical protein